MKLMYVNSSLKDRSYKQVYDKFRMSSDGKYLIKALRTTLIVLFSLQLVSTLERQVFDFLGYMWAPIIGNFFQIIVVILGIFGAWTFHKSFIIVYATWSLIWLGWNIFVICLYLEVGILNRNRERYILTVGTESKSWWLENGIGCEVANSSWMDDEEDVVEAGRKIPPESSVQGCILQYYYVEVIHAAVQCLLSLAGFVASCLCIWSFMEDDDPMSSANDELEFVKMRYRTPTHMAAYQDSDEGRDNLAFDNINLTTEFSPPTERRSKRRGQKVRGTNPEQPPSYDTTMRNQQAATNAATNAANQYYASDRQSVRSKASTRSKRSTHHRDRTGPGSSTTYSEPVRDLPWVHITPSNNTDQQHIIRHFP